MNNFILNYDQISGITTITITDTNCLKNPSNVLLLGIKIGRKIEEHGGLIRLVLDLSNNSTIDSATKKILKSIQNQVDNVHGAMVILLSKNSKNDDLCKEFAIRTKEAEINEYFRKSIAIPLKIRKTATG